MKRGVTAALMALWIPAMLAFAEEPRAAEQELRELEETRRKAIREGDFKVLSEVYAEDFSGILGNARVVDRPQLFEVFKGNDPGLSFAVDEVAVRVYGDAAIFTGRLVGRTTQGEVALASRFTHVFIRRGGSWLIVAGHSTSLPKS